VSPTRSPSADHDPTGKNAARICAGRWQRAGRTVIRLTPELEGADFNDLKGRRTLQECLGVVEHNASLFFARRQNEHQSTLAAGKPVLDEERRMNAKRRGHSRFAATTANDTPEFADALLRQTTIAGNSSENLALFRTEQLAERSLERDAPFFCRPTDSSSLLN
jgi:hypothetical protein